MGPHPRNFRQSLPRGAKLEGLRSALSAQVQSGRLLVLEGAVPGPNRQLVTVSQPAGLAAYAGPAREGE